MGSGVSISMLPCPLALRSSPPIFNELPEAFRYLARQEEGFADLFGFPNDIFLVAETEEACADKMST